MATTTTTANFVIPALGGFVSVPVVSTATMVAGTSGTIAGSLQGGGLGSFTISIISITDATDVVVEVTSSQPALVGKTMLTGATVTFVVPAAAPLVCTPNALTTASACFSSQCLGPDDREAIQLMAMVFALSASGGANYVNNLPQLLKDSASWMVLNEDQRRQINTYFTVVNAIEDGAGLTLNMNLLRANAKCFLCLPWEQKKNIQVFLKCALYAIDEPE